jgi:cytochrome b
MAPRWEFTAFSRLLHWTMAAMVLAMLCIGVAVVASLADYHVLVSIHRPLGIAILVVVPLREPALEPAAAFSRDHVRHGAPGRHRVGSRCMA